MIYRFALPADRPFILSGWSSSLRQTRDVPFIAMADWAMVMRPVLEKSLDRATCIVAAGEDPVRAGFLAYEPPTSDDLGYVYYCYVAQPFRRQGVARALFAAARIDPGSRFAYACRTRGSWECRAKFPVASYDPFRARYPKETHERQAAARAP